MVQKKMISYEASKWYIKLWRQRWYIYAIFLHIFKNYLKLDIIVDVALDIIVDEDELSEQDKLRQKWRDIKRHVELSKMYKFSSKTKNYERKG